MKKNGFTIIEFLVCLAMLGIVLFIGICASRKMLATSLVSFRTVNDDEVFKAAKAYVNENNIDNTYKSYICVKVSDLINYGYLLDTNDQKLKEKTIKLKKNVVTKTISAMEYINDCE